MSTTTSTGGADLSPFAAENFSFMSPDFAELNTPTLIVAGDPLGRIDSK
jgi:hypothetical protein